MAGTMKNTNDKAELYPMPMYWLEGVPYLPHYTKEGYWVSPGGITRTTTWLKERNAKQNMQPLWLRSWVLERFMNTNQDL
jgi:hypothetical protein